MNQSFYRACMSLVSKSALPIHESTLSPKLTKTLHTLFQNEKARGVSLALFSNTQIQLLSMGEAKKEKGTPVTADTHFRIASIAKFVTAYCAVLLFNQGKIDLDTDVSNYLGYPLANPMHKESCITLRHLLSHTASLHDGVRYNQGIFTRMPLQEVLQGDSFTNHRPGTVFEYSNLGAGMIGCILENATKTPFDTLMREQVFEPLGINASYFPQKITGTLADAWRLFPPAKGANYHAKARQTQALPTNGMDQETGYLLPHGNLCIKAKDLALIAKAIANDKKTFDQMRTPITPFDQREPNMSQGLGTFIYNAPTKGKTLYGHQGLAYGAVHGLFMDEMGNGFVALTSSISEHRHGVLTDANLKMCALLWQGELHG